MRLVVLLVAAGLAAPAFAAGELIACAEIESAVERLDCYDRLAREARQRQTGKTATSPPQAPSDCQPAAEPRVSRQPPAPAAAEEQNPGLVEARIVSVRKAPLGEQIMTLSNGQVWIENEPGRRRITPNQDVTIRKHRLHYEMELKSQPNVAVHRLR